MPTTTPNAWSDALIPLAYRHSGTSARGRGKRHRADIAGQVQRESAEQSGGPSHEARGRDRNLVSFVVSTALGLYLFRGWPFPAENNMLQMVLLQKPYLYHGMNHGFHSTSSLLWQEKHDLNAIQDHVGHPSSSSTLVYLRADAAQKAQSTIAAMSFGGTL